MFNPRPAPGHLTGKALDKRCEHWRAQRTAKMKLISDECGAVATGLMPNTIKEERTSMVGGGEQREGLRGDLILKHLSCLSEMVH